MEDARPAVNDTKPLFDPKTHYLVEVRGTVREDWLQSFDGLVGVSVDDSGQKDGITVLEVQADQSGIIGLMRRLHGLGMVIVRLNIVSERHPGGLE